MSSLFQRLYDAMPNQQTGYKTAKFLANIGSIYFISKENAFTFLNFAISDTDIKFLKLLLSKNINLDRLNEYGYTPLIYAICQRNIDIMQLLLAAGANPNIPDIYGETPLCFSIFHTHPSILQFLLDKGANPDIPNLVGETPLFLAVYLDFRAIIQLLLESGANPDIPNKEKVPPLYLAATPKFANNAQLLLSYGANVEALINREFFLDFFITRDNPYLHGFLLSVGFKTILNGQDILHMIESETERNKLQITRNNLKAAIEGLIGKTKVQKEHALNDVADILRIFRYVLKLLEDKETLQCLKPFKNTLSDHIAAYLQNKKIIAAKEEQLIAQLNVFWLLQRKFNLPSETMNTIVDDLFDAINVEKVMQRYQLTRDRADWGYFHIQAKQKSFMQLSQIMNHHDWEEPFAFEAINTSYSPTNTFLLG